MGEEDDGTDIAHTDVNPRLTFINREGGSVLPRRSSQT